MPIVEINQVAHPLLGRRVPTLKSVLERCDPEATTTLQAAMALTRARVASQTRALAIAKELQHAPWGEPGVRWHEPARAVTSTDLLRALLALHGGRVAEIAFASEGVGARFRETEAHWGRIVVEVTDEAAEPLGLELELEPIFARRWALTNGDEPIDLDMLLGRLADSSLRQLALFDDRCSEGLITEEEARNKLVDQMVHAGVSPRFSVPMPPAYWDRHGGLNALDRLLTHSPGGVVVGPRGSGRHALVEAWGRRRHEAGGAPLRNFGFNIDNFHGGGWVEWRGANVMSCAAIDTRSIAVLSDFGAELDAPDAESRRFPEYCLDFASNPANEFRLVILTTPEELAQLEERLPTLRSFPKLEVPALRDDELLATWICQTLAVEDRLGISLPVERLVDRVTSRSPAGRRSFDRHADLVCDTELTGHEAVFRRAARRVLNGTWTRLPIQTLTLRIERDPALASWVDPESWPSLVRLDAALHARAGERGESELRAPRPRPEESISGDGPTE